MIQLTAQTKILLASAPADFRCGIDGPCSTMSVAAPAEPEQWDVVRLYQSQ